MHKSPEYTEMQIGIHSLQLNLKYFLRIFQPYLRKNGGCNWIKENANFLPSVNNTSFIVLSNLILEKSMVHHHYKKKKDLL